MRFVDEKVAALCGEGLLNLRTTLAGEAACRHDNVGAEEEGRRISDRLRDVLEHAHRRMQGRFA